MDEIVDAFCSDGEGSNYFCTIPSPPKTKILSVNVGKHIYT